MSLVLEHLFLLLDCDFVAWDASFSINHIIDLISIQASILLAQNRSHSLCIYLAFNGKSSLVWESNGQLYLDKDMLISSMTRYLEELQTLTAYRSGLPSALTKSLSYLNKMFHLNSVAKINGRILIISPGSDAIDHYISVINAAFCAQKMVFIPNIHLCYCSVRPYRYFTDW